MADRIWEVVLVGASGTGVPVSAAEDDDAAGVGRLAKGALVRQLAPPSGSRHSRGRRLQFCKITGVGPESGWVTTSLKEKDFLVRTYDVRPERLLAAADVGAPLTMPADGRRPFDIIIYGASGFTGSLAAEHLDALVASRAPAGRAVSWAIAGRSAAKLRPLEQRCRTRPTVFQAESPQDLTKLAALCRVLVAAAGPYQLFGEPLVQACIEQGTHYVDVTGEVLWVRDIIGKYHATARQKGVMVVHCAGQVCAIDEMICYMLAKKLGPLRQFREYFTQFGGMTGGTVATNIATLQGTTPDACRILSDPFFLGGQRKCGVRPEDQDCQAAAQDALFPALWLQPAYSSATASRVIRRSCHLFEETAQDGVSYGDGVSVVIREGALSQRAAEMQAMSLRQPDPAVASAAAQQLGLQVSKGEQPQPGQGPPPETRGLYYSDAYGVGESERGDWAHVHYTGPEAYEATAMCCVTAALCLVEEVDRLRPSSRGGVLTPAYALHGSTFLDRLQDASFGLGAGRKMRFELMEGKPPETALRDVVMEKTKKASIGQDDIAQGRRKAFA